MMCPLMVLSAVYVAGFLFFFIYFVQRLFFSFKISHCQDITLACVLETSILTLLSIILITSMVCYFVCND